MDLYSGLPFWLIKNALYSYFNPLEKDHSTDVAIIGSGITGALVAHELCSAGIKCSVFDKRAISTGSSVASTALLQYEIDVPLSKMVKIVEEETAVGAYRCGLQAIDDIGTIFKDLRINAGFKQVPSIFYASDKKGLDLIKEEYEIRKKYKLPADLLNSGELFKTIGITAPGALMNHSSAQMDAYMGATGLMQHHSKNNNLELFSHTKIDKWEEKSRGYELLTDDGYKIKCKYVVVAAGFEAGMFLPKPVMKLTSTYALASQPIKPEQFWHDRSLIWETREPYLYIRTTSDNRIIVGGEDIPYQNPILRDKLLRAKTRKLEKKFQKLFPEIPFITEMAWCGTFSSTEDGLPYIGTLPGKNRMFFALGYGGNGITFSMIAAQMIRNKIKGLKDEREKIFGFERK